jgi:hypothetical protein
LGAGVGAGAGVGIGVGAGGAGASLAQEAIKGTTMISKASITIILVLHAFIFTAFLLFS